MEADSDSHAARVSSAATAAVLFSRITYASGNATIINSNGSTYFYNNSTAGNATIINESGNRIFFSDNSTAGNARLINNGGTFDFSASSSMLHPKRARAARSCFELGIMDQVLVGSTGSVHIKSERSFLKRQKAS